MGGRRGATPDQTGGDDGGLSGFFACICHRRHGGRDSLGVATMSDMGHDWTDEQIEKLSAKMYEMYAQAANEMQDKLEEWMRDYEKQRKAWEKAVKVGVKTKQEYDNWLKDRAMEYSWQTNMTRQLSEDALNADIRARQMINDELPTICAENANMAAYDICKATGLDLSFTIYDHDTIRFLMTDPAIFPTVDVAKDLRWNQQKLNSAITQSVLQGESMDNAAKRLTRVLAMNRSAAMMVARTSITYVEGMGKRNSFKRAADMGIPLKMQWNALHDGRTRYEHRQMDGVQVEVGEKFNVDGHKMTGPGDPTAPLYLICNCRCRLSGEIGYENLTPAVTIGKDKFPKDVTYEEWKSGVYRTDASGRETRSSKIERGVKP